MTTSQHRPQTDLPSGNSDVAAEATPPAAPEIGPTSYLPLITGFWALLLSLPMLSRRLRNRDPQPQTPLDLVQLCAGTYFLSRVVARERAGSFLREPFVEPAPGAENPMHGEQTRPSGSGVVGAIGELVTCTRCVGLWAAAALRYLQVLAPREARVVMPVLAAAGANNFLQAAFARLTATRSRSTEPPDGGFPS